MSTMSGKISTCNKRALSDKEAAIYIGMGTSWLRHGRVEGSRQNRIHHPPFIKIGRNIRYLIEDLDKWLDSFRKLDSLAQLYLTDDVISKLK